ncbi:MAG: hypothetical protein M1481_05465 [Candidatus Thermoplasmatota archaeon]|jgi:hypothetical protein|nr:hypothetical protein [Candidatus Thermoplasmatota archaeon]MCL5963661.1 hypothetical protein [Candidatus Thermoplasmatota archaeon]
MAPNLSVSKETEDMLNDFKPLFEAIMEKKFSNDSYVNTIIQLGIQKLFREIIPSDDEWEVIELIFKKNRKFLCSLVTEVFINSETKDNMKRKEIKTAIQKYIG